MAPHTACAVRDWVNVRAILDRFNDCLGSAISSRVRERGSCPTIMSCSRGVEEFGELLQLNYASIGVVYCSKSKFKEAL